MNKNYIVIAIIVLITALLIYQSKAVKRMYRSEVSKRFINSEKASNPIITENDIRHLPEPVQKYLRYVGVIGGEKVRNLRVVFEGEMKMDPKQDWIKINAEQYNFLSKSERLFYIQGNRAGVPFMGLDSYRNGKGNMLIKVVSMVPVVDAKGSEMDMSEMVTFFNDMCLLAPASLIDPRIQWETIDPLTVKGIFTEHGRKVAAVLYFNQLGELTNFITEDRYQTTDGKVYRRAKWSTPVKGYQEFHVGNGQTAKILNYGEAIWHFPEGDLCYAKFKLVSVEYNCDRFK